ncbi:MAG TPA: hypothetical protein VH679_10585 [Vicinamibacterales bacterium]|jgi:hypothetical protein
MNALDEIKHLYFNATKATIQRDLTRAITLLKGMKTEAEREKAAVYMDGLSQMRSEWAMMGHGQKRRPGKRRF